MTPLTNDVVTARTRPQTDAVGGRFAALEAWRGVACLMVFAYHCGLSQPRPPFAWYGFSGVHLFFVLSGYLLFRPYAAAMVARRPPPDLGNFYLRRLLRIVPPYLVSLAAFMLMRRLGRQTVPSAYNVVAHALLVFNYDPRLDFFSINPVFWSLAIEVQFYLLLPVLCWLATRPFTGRTAAVACVVLTALIGVVARFAEVHWLGHLYAATATSAAPVRFRSVLAYLDLFACGMAVAAVATATRTTTRPGALTTALLAGTGLAVAVAANDWCSITAQGGWQSASSTAFLTLFPTVLAVGVGLMLQAVVAGTTLNRNTGVGARTDRPALAAAGRPLCWIGEISYSLYLYHIGVQFFVFRLHLWQSRPFLVAAAGNTAVALFPALAIAAAMFYAVEWPSLWLVARVRRRQRPAQRTTPLQEGGTPSSEWQSAALLGP